MRRHALITMVLMMASVPAQANSVTLAFGSLDSQDGQSVTSYSDQGWMLFDRSGMTVVGSANPAYLGATGLIPSTSGGALLELYMPATYPTAFLVDHVSFNIGPDDGISQAVDFDTFAAYAQGGFQIVAEATTDQTLTGLATSTLTVGSVASIMFWDSNGPDFPQFTSVTIVYGTSVPEPSGLAMGAIGIGAVFAVGRCQRRR